MYFAIGMQMKPSHSWRLKFWTPSFELVLLKYNTEEVCIVHLAQQLTRSRICEEHSDLFSGIRCLLGEYDIGLDRDSMQYLLSKIDHDKSRTR